MNDNEYENPNLNENEDLRSNRRLAKLKRIMENMIKKLFLLVILMFCAWNGTMAQTSRLFDDGWQFVRDGKSVNVNLPHDWDIYDAPDPETGETGTGGGWFQGGEGEYHKKF